ncbi:MAG: DUF465 domain-containing protein [Desulfuromonadales bacterium]|nr:DUF465 domain-containing protein [Desulfuromonadales bacterium]NIR34018.1 DUF465 domain-containing protein [Desulfuromonadales bacterium]NIS44069.1 DUF465 domain-containing protein [Desulfuromonadales bacterium]
MEYKDEALVQELCDNNPRFRKLYEEHLILEKELDNLNRKGFLNSDEELEKKKIQKLKLAGKDEMERMLFNMSRQ